MATNCEYSPVCRTLRKTPKDRFGDSTPGRYTISLRGGSVDMLPVYF